MGRDSRADALQKRAENRRESGNFFPLPASKANVGRTQCSLKLRTAKRRTCMKRKGISLILALVLLLSLAACGGKQTPAEDGGKPEEEISGVTPDTDGTTDDTTDDTQGTPEDSEVSETQDADGSTEQNRPENGTAQRPADSQNGPASKVDLTAFYESLTGGEEWPAMMQAEDEVLDSFYPGLSDIAANQCLVYTAMISAAVGEIALVEVRNADDVQKVKDIFQARIDYQVGDDANPGGAWYPESIEGWKNGSRIVSNGNYVMLAALSDGADDAVAAFNALFA